MNFKIYLKQNIKFKRIEKDTPSEHYPKEN